MKIISLQSENVKRIKAVHITPEGAVVTIKGNNAQGKTSVLDSIQLALGGKSFQPPKVIREGQETARVVLELEDLVVERRWTQKGSYLEVRSREGAKYPSPQAVLDKLVGSLSFDPLAFMRFDGKKQAETLRQLVGLDFAPLEDKRQASFDARTQVNREVTALKAQLDRLPLPAGTPAEEVSVADLVQEQQRLTGVRTENERVRRMAAEARREWQGLADRQIAAEERVIRLRQDLAKAEAEQIALGSKMDMASDVMTAREEEAKTLVDPDLAAVTEQLRTVEQTNAGVRRARERRQLESRHQKAVEDAEALTVAIATVDAEKKKALEGARFPVEGLSFSEEGITFGGIPLEQASAAEQLRVSLAMGIALNPKLKVILIRDGSLLDESSLRTVAEMAAQANAQVWMERVGTAGEVGVVIEDGEAFGAEAQPVEQVA